MDIKKMVTAIFVIVSLHTFAYATNGMRMIGFGPVQRSMGGVSVGLPLDAASVITNPAAMSVLANRIDFGASYFAPTVDYKATENASLGLGGAVVASDNKTIESDVGASPIPALGVIIPINEQMKFGIGAYGISGIGVDYESNLYGGTTRTSYSQMRFTPGIAYKINQMVSAGVVINVMYAQMGYNVAGGFAQTPHMNDAAFGYGATISVLVTPVEMLTIGVAYETKSYFQEFEFNTSNGKDKLEFNQPMVATIGFGIRPIQGLKIGLDIEWINWEDTNGKDLPEYKEVSLVTTQAFNLNWENQLVYKFGVQYSPIALLDIRLGYNYGKMPLDSDRAFENIAFPAVAEHHITAGVGINLSEKFTLNIGFMYSPETSLSGANAGNPVTNSGQGISDYETNMSQYSIDFGLAYIF